MTKPMPLSRLSRADLEVVPTKPEEYQGDRLSNKTVTPGPGQTQEDWFPPRGGQIQGCPTRRKSRHGSAWGTQSKLASCRWFLCWRSLIQQYLPSEWRGWGSHLKLREWSLALSRCHYLCRAVPGTCCQHPTPFLSEEALGLAENTSNMTETPKADFTPASEKNTTEA